MRTILLTVLLFSLTLAQAADTRHFDIGAPTLTDIYIDPANGSDDNTGSTPQTAMRTIDAAWQRIPIRETLTTGYHLHLAAGYYSAETMPNYWESRYGTYEHPILITGEGDQTRIATINLFDSHYFYLMEVLIDEGIDAFHCERCDHVLLRGVTLHGAAPETYQTQEVVKVNQSTYFFIEDSDISGAWNVAIDFVAVQYGHVTGSRIHEAGDWCMYFKGGSAYLDVEANDIFDCETGGFSAGQGTGFQFMVPPFLHYETYYIRFVNNLVHETNGAGVGVQGSYNVLIAYNTFTQIGERSHMVDIIFGSRSCDAPEHERCDEYRALGGWGNSLVASNDNYVRIPNRHVFLYNNVFYNPPGYQSAYMHFSVMAPYSGAAQENSGVPVPTVTDDDLHIVGNAIWNGGPDHPLGVESDAGCASENPTCNAAQIRRDNLINTLEPVQGQWISRTDFAPVPLPPFAADDPTVPPPPSLDNPVPLDYSGQVRGTNDVIGARLP